MKEISLIDKEIHKKIRNNVSEFIKNSSLLYDNESSSILDVAPQDYLGAREFYKKSKVYTADIDEKSNADFIIDICNDNSNIINSEFFDLIICTEVLEHTLNPFNAIREIHRLLKKGGTLMASTPFNFRIHGPSPDCWRFTEYGLKELLKNFESVEIKSLEDENRFLMPFHYTIFAKK
jgi:SAM-dependent methyltransferase